MTREITDPDHLTETQAVADGVADILLAGATSPAQRPRSEVVSAWTTISLPNDVNASKKQKPYMKFDPATRAADAAVERMQLMAEGAQLILDAAKLFTVNKKVARRVKPSFWDLESLPNDANGDPALPDAGGYFDPPEPLRSLYKLYVTWEQDSLHGTIRLDKRDYKFGVSFMADTLFHELLHVWFIHQYPNSGTGHRGDVVAPAFAGRIKRFQQQLVAFETAIQSP